MAVVEVMKSEKWLLLGVVVVDEVKSEKWLLYRVAIVDIMKSENGCYREWLLCR